VVGAYPHLGSYPRWRLFHHRRRDLKKDLTTKNHSNVSIINSGSNIFQPPFTPSPLHVLFAADNNSIHYPLSTIHNVAQKTASMYDHLLITNPTRKAFCYHEIRTQTPVYQQTGESSYGI